VKQSCGNDGSDGKPGKPTPGFPPFPQILGNLADNARFPHFHSSGDGLFYWKEKDSKRKKRRPFTQKS
jgi:hypothetical protein